jgi:hypothetical protein
MPGKFPTRITIPDLVNAEHLLAARILGLSHVRAVMGLPIVGTPQQSPFDLLVWTTQENSIVYPAEAWRRSRRHGHRTKHRIDSDHVTSARNRRDETRRLPGIPD